MSFLQTILVELHNCLNVEKDIPLVWSREFAVRLKQNTDHWNKVQRQDSHVGDMDFQDDEQIRVPYHDEEEEDAGAFYGRRYKDMERDAINDPEDPARDDYAGFGGDEPPDRMDPRNEMGDDEDEDLYQQRDNYNKGLVPDEEDSHLTDWGREYHSQGEENEEGGFAAFMADREKEEEEEERKAQFSVGGERSEYDDDCPECFGTGHEFPRLKGVCPSCNGSGKADGESHRRELGRADAHAFGMPSEEEQEDVQGDDLGPKQQRKLNANPDETDPENVAVDDQYGLDDPNDQEDFGDEGLPNGDQQEWDDPDYQGVIRTAPGAHLIYKRQQEDGTFDELWQYNLGDDFQKELDTRRGILAGTDIPINKMRDPDNTQSYELWTIGNGQLLQVKGLPN